MTTEETHPARACDAEGWTVRERSCCQGGSVRIPQSIRRTQERFSATGRRHTPSSLASLSAILGSFVGYCEAGLGGALSPARQAQIDVVSDVLGQAHSILENDKNHPAAAAMLVGAALEEFLRTWVEAAGLSLGNANSGLNAYADVLRTADLITKQDAKDITSWAGMRNHAAHGEWEHVSDRSRVSLMLEGVNLFMRQKQVT